MTRMSHGNSFLDFIVIGPRLRIKLKLMYLIYLIALLYEASVLKLLAYHPDRL